MLEQTIERAQSVSEGRSIIVCNEEHRFIVAEQARTSNSPVSILLEPQGRNTAPAITLAALELIDGEEDPLLLVLAADHVVADKAAFVSAVESASQLAESGKLVTFGSIPNRPETGYGYIRRGSKVTGGYLVDHFVEKPSVERAQGFLDRGDYFWNSGIFLFKASCFLREVEKYCPEVFENCKAAHEGKRSDLDFLRINELAFQNCPSHSVDHAIMEKTKKAAVVPLNAGWSDVGSWSSLWELADRDSNDNACSGDVLVQNTTKCLVHSSSRLVAAVGLENLVVVETKDSVLVANKDQVQNVKDLVEQLRLKQRDECKLHREVYRPWGKFESIDRGDRYLVKRITVKAGAKLSVQKHFHRAEHWIVVSGTAIVQRNNEELLVTENESIYLPVGSVHSLTNPGKIPLELIEVQSGAYLNEDDIIRINDEYGRV